MVRARLLYKEAHSKGHADATFNLGVLCTKQGDVYDEAHSNGDWYVTTNLAILYSEQAVQ